MIAGSYGIAKRAVTLPERAALFAGAAVSQFRHTGRFSDYPQVHSGVGGVINKGNVRIVRVDNNIALTA
jgi:hypothetical protein